MPDRTGTWCSSQSISRSADQQDRPSPGQLRRWAECTTPRGGRRRYRQRLPVRRRSRAPPLQDVQHPARSKCPIEHSEFPVGATHPEEVDVNGERRGAVDGQEPVPRRPTAHTLGWQRPRPASDLQDRLAWPGSSTSSAHRTRSETTISGFSCWLMEYPACDEPRCATCQRQRVRGARRRARLRRAGR